MWNSKIILTIVLIVGLCSANDASTKTKKSNKEAEAKEKRDVNTGSAPYSYEMPQKQFHTPIHTGPVQAKYTSVEHQQPQRVAPLQYTQQPKQEISVAPIQQHQAAVEQYHPTTFHQAQNYHQEPQNMMAQAYKAYEEFALAYPNYESFSQMPIVHYNGDYDKITSSLISVPGYDFKSAPIYSSFKTTPSFSYAPFSQHSSFSEPKFQSYVAQHQPAPQSYASAPYSYVNSYVPANNQHQASHAPTTIYVQQAAPQKLTKIPEYATGSKGLGHFSSLNVAPISVHPSNSHVKNTYDVTSYTQTERPFKPSAFLGASHVPSHDSYSEQSISAGKPLNTVEYAAPSKNYLPAKESYQYVPHGAQIEYQIQYVPQHQPVKSYLPPVANSYLPPKQVEAPKNSYIPPSAAPVKSYLPAKLEKPVSTYLPPSKAYLPPSAPYHSHQVSAAPAHGSANSHHQYQSQDSYEHAEYQSVISQGGHK